MEDLHPLAPRYHGVADFLTVKVWTLSGFVRFHVFFVMSLAKCELRIVHIGCQTDGAVMKQVTRNLTDCDDDFLIASSISSAIMIRCSPSDSGTPSKARRSKPFRPKSAAIAERLRRAFRQIEPTRVPRPPIFLGEKSFRNAVISYVEHHHYERNH